MTEKQRAYHHGDLKEALIAATDEILKESGIEGFSLRHAARRAGVSVGAPAHHFGSAIGLLTEVAILGYQELDIYLQQALSEMLPPNEQIQALGKAYVMFALEHSGRFRLMFRKDLIDRHNSRYVEVSRQALIHFAVVIAKFNHITLDQLMEKQNYGAVIAAWSLVHGVAHLALEEKFNGILNDTPDQDFKERLLPEILKSQWPSLKVEIEN